VPNGITKAGLVVVIPVLKLVYSQLRPWLKEQAAKSDTPLDNWVLDLLDKLLDITG
jgi:hypothetical protein